MRRRTKGLKGNRYTRFAPQPNTHVELSFRDDSTKFYKRPQSFKTRAVWKKYPIPFVWDNPVPEGDAVLVRKYYPIKEKEAA